MQLNCIIIDDEPLARKGLIEYISDVDFLHVLGDFDSPLKATQLLNTRELHILFLDIQMPKLSGIDFLKSLQHPPQVIFTTAYPQYALEGFDLNAIDYLVKPVSFDRFVKAVMKAREYYEVRSKNTPAATEQPVADYFFIKADGKLVKIFFDDILFAEAMQNYVTIHVKGKKFITYLTFKSIEDYLPTDRFIKTHKSFIASVQKIDSIEANDIRIGDNHIPISRNLKEEVMEKLLQNRFLKR